MLPSVQAERGELLSERIEKALVFLSQPRLDKADARNLDLGRSRVPGHSRCAREQQEPAPSHVWMAPDQQEVIR